LPLLKFQPSYYPLELGLDALLQVRENGPELFVAFLRTVLSIIMLFKVFELFFW